MLVESPLALPLPWPLTVEVVTQMATSAWLTSLNPFIPDGQYHGSPRFRADRHTIPIVIGATVCCNNSSSCYILTIKLDSCPLGSQNINTRTTRASNWTMMHGWQWSPTPCQLHQQPYHSALDARIPNQNSCLVGEQIIDSKLYIRAQFRNSVVKNSPDI